MRKLLKDQDLLSTKEIEPFNLDQIITSQVDEPSQKLCIYRIKLGQNIEKKTQIRVKSINFLEQSAYAIYFYDMTQHMKSKEQLQDLQLESMENDIREPLTTILMFMQCLLGYELEARAN